MLINDITRFMYEHCTGVGEEKAINQDKFIASIGEVLSATELKPRTIEELWALSWDKPIWSWISAKMASKVRASTIDNDLFQSYRNFSEDGKLSLNSLKGLRRPADTLRRIQGLYSNFQHIYEAYEKAASKLLNPESEFINITSASKNIDSVRKVIGVPPFKIKNSLFDQFKNLHGYKAKASATRLHTLADYGLPVCKTDLWIVRFTQTIAIIDVEHERKSINKFFLDKNLNFDVNLSDWNKGFLESNPQFAFWIVDFLIENHFDFYDLFWSDHQLDVISRFNAHRFVDLILAKFGMELEIDFGLVESPMDILDPSNARCNKQLIKDYPHLSLLAAKVDNLRAQEGSKKLDSHKPFRLPRAPKESKPKAADVIPEEVNQYRIKLAKFQQYLFDSKIKALRAKRVSWGDILVKMLKTPADKFEETKF